MRRLRILILVATLALSVLVVGAAPAQAKQVDCFFHGNYQITCVNNTQYWVYMRLNMFTECGLKIKYFVIRGNRYTTGASCYIDRITWRWHY